jgi:hypothetical protein
MTLAEIFIKFAEYSPWAAVAIYMIWQQRKDYKGVCTRLNEVEDYCKTTLAGLVERTIDVIDKNNDVIRHCKRTEEHK